MLKKDCSFATLSYLKSRSLEVTLNDLSSKSKSLASKCKLCFRYKYVESLVLKVLFAFKVNRRVQNELVFSVVSKIITQQVKLSQQKLLKIKKTLV